MNADLTFNSVVYKKNFDEKDFSLRRSTAGGINQPFDLTIRTQEYVHSGNKQPGTRYLMRFDITEQLANDAGPVVHEAYVVLGIPKLGAQAFVDSAVAALKAAVADANFIPAVLNGEK